jgi:hypothetical protein
MGLKVDDWKMTKYTRRDCNLLNLLGMFQTVLDAIELCLDDGNAEAAKHRIREAGRTIHKLKGKADAPTLQD